MRIDRLTGFVVIMACGPAPGTSTTDGGTTDPSTAGGSSSTGAVPTTMAEETGSGPGDPTTGGPTGDATTQDATTLDPTTLATTGEATTSTGALETTDTGETTGESLCGEPDGEHVGASWSITVAGEPLTQDLLAPCVVVTSEVVGSQWTAGLDCDVQGDPVVVQLLVSTTPAPFDTLFPGEAMVLEYRAQPIFWTNEWFALRSAGNPLSVAVSGVRADRLVPDGTTPVDFHGVDMVVLDGLCEPTADGPCGQTTRLAIDAEWSLIERVIFDGQQRGLVGFGGTVTIWVAHATRPQAPVRCDDVPPAWFEVVVNRSSGP